MSVNLTIVHRSEMPLIEYSTQVVTDAGEARWPIYLHAVLVVTDLFCINHRANRLGAAHKDSI